MFDVLPIVAYVISNNDDINDTCNGNIIPGLSTTLADSYLADGPCVGINEQNENTESYIGSTHSGEYAFDTLLEISSYSKASENTAKQLSLAIRNVLLSHVSTVYGGVTYNFWFTNPSRTSMYDQSGGWWRHILKTRVIGNFTIT